MVTGCMSRRRRAAAPTTRHRDGIPPRRTDLTVIPFATVPVSSTREMRVSMSCSPTGRAVVVQSYARETAEAEMVAVGRPFTVFRAQLDALLSALSATGPLLDALGPATAPS